ncbi:DUF2975 domain-containing protein [Qipengyuania sediminis]|uniref:DUF2975 domain-containing protein n=1 Tax=Qipengyuania sediminis TaxID=1532023 RepID=UPI0014054C78|nr:DUF2975 domain-containing protein [Qipengyuania sediminis]
MSNALESRTLGLAKATRPGPDPLLTAAQVMLWVLMAGLIVAVIATIGGLVTHISAHGLPLRRDPWDPQWQPISGPLFALAALWLVGDSVRAVLAMIRSVGRDRAFESDNVARMQRVAWNTIGLAITGVIAAVAGTGISGDINGFDIGVDMPTSIGFALLLFILARVFRQGAAMQTDLEGTV